MDYQITVSQDTQTTYLNMLKNKELAEYIYNRIQELNWGSRGELFTKLTPITLEFWIQQFKTRDCVGHSEWSERYQRNIWIKDDNEEVVSH